MKSEKPENYFLRAIHSAWKLEWGTVGGRFNVFFTALITSLVVLFSISDNIRIIIFAIVFKKEYETLSIWQTLAGPVICGSLCFIYMMFISHDMDKVKMLFNDKNSARTETASTLEDKDLHK